MDALLLSFKLAACVSAILMIVGTPVAYWLAYSNWRGKFLVDRMVAIIELLISTLCLRRLLYPAAGIEFIRNDASPDQDFRRPPVA